MYVDRRICKAYACLLYTSRLREKVIYSVFVRNHTKEGTFQALEGDLDRLAALGTDIILSLIHI